MSPFTFTSTSLRLTLTRTHLLRPTTLPLTRSLHVTPRSLYASPKGKMELYSDESGSTGAGIDDVSKTDAAYDTSKGPEEAAKGIEQETGKDFTQRSPANKEYSEDKKNMPLGTSAHEAKKGSKEGK